MSGTIDAHTHVTAFEFLGGDFHCGRPWHPFGIAYALPRLRARTSRAPTGRSRASSTTAAPLHAHDTAGLADVPRLALADRPGRGGRLLHGHQAGLDGRAAGDGHPAGRQRGAVRADDHAAQPVQRHGRGAPPGPRPARAPGLHRRPVRRSRQGLLPDRHQPVPGPAGDQLRASWPSSRANRGLASVQLRRVPRRARSAARPRSTPD